MGRNVADGTISLLHAEEATVSNILSDAQVFTGSVIRTRASGGEEV